ncbi:glucuronate isomerase [Aurantiacibacter gangjinensis]|uniref:Uronate isomerase n=1 Tax=Aurantiacibacter gangjinensis TaxID=502682 RepID=A0A0G9MS31_9SPHN|nr:glucuronate isomerase [Aurantiacibacter gangjinensis]APE26896.1 Uronate isomerase [Aurantiacibacter gangjinensis]KLE33359.1 glucuronate isomerase [Aurantiacibacter gangjinensis]
MPKLELNENRLFPADPTTRDIARRLYAEVRDLPIISPHGHTDPSWFADNEAFSNPADLLITPDHYVFRMLYSQGIRMEDLGVPLSGGGTSANPREVWRIFAQNYHLFDGTPSRIWHDWVYSKVFGLEETLSAETADHYYDVIDAKLQEDAYRPRALFERYNIEVIATTEDPLDPLDHHAKLQADGWGKKVITAFRPDNVLDPDYEGFAANVRTLGEITGFETTDYQGYLDALIDRREYFKRHGATSSDHGHPTAATADLSRAEAEALFAKALAGDCSAQEAETFRGHMLVEMARMSLDDGLVMQIHPGSHRNHNAMVFERFGRDKGADIPTRTDYVDALRPLLSRYGNEPSLTVILFTLDETVYSRELAPLAGHYPVLKLGPPWWFHDSPEGMRRFREQATETAGFYNTVGFNDDTRAFLSIPARHDLARRMDCGFLARLVAEHRMLEDDAHRVAQDLTYNLAKAAYRL